MARHEAGERDHLGRQGELLVFYNTIAQALTADNKPDPNGCGRVKLLDWIRKRRPDLLPVARLIMGTPSFIRLVKAEGALRLPSADDLSLAVSFERVSL